MKIDWKVVSQSYGYRKLKAAVLGSIKNKDRNKKELYKHFNWIIGRATHYAYHKNTTIDVILDQWEADRTYWWFGYYSDNRQPLLNLSSQVCRPSIRTYFKKDAWYRNDPVKKKATVLKHIMHEQKEAAKKTGRKPRWDTDRKKREARYKKLVEAEAAKSSP